MCPRFVLPVALGQHTTDNRFPTEVPLQPAEASRRSAERLPTARPSHLRAAPRPPDVTPGASPLPGGVVSAALGWAEPWAAHAPSTGGSGTRCECMCARGGGGAERARRSRVVGSARGAGSLSACRQARAPAAAAMSAIIEQEFQEIDATNDWQARYLVSGGGRSGSEREGERGEGRRPAAPPVAGTRRLSGERKSLGHDSFSGAGSETAGGRCACSRPAAAASPREGAVGAG